MKCDAKHIIQWDSNRWPNFTQTELGCRHCGDVYVWPEFLDNLQRLRDRVGRPLVILSAHRCAIHNALVGGAPLSQHLSLAVDISLKRHEQFQLVQLAKLSGFTGFGCYTTFLHLDMGRPRHWYGGPKARALWQLH